MADKQYLIKKDTRERTKDGNSWEFSSSANCLGMEICKLDTGDYTLAGYENILCIERKGAISEFAKNICEARFERELVRMDAFHFAYLILEFTMDDILDFPYTSTIPKNKWKYLRVTNYFILRRLNEIMLKHKVKPILCGAHGKEVASSLFKLVVENTIPCLT